MATSVGEEPSLAENLALKELAELLAGGNIASREQLEKAKKEAARKHHLDRFISSSAIYSHLPESERARWSELVRVHPRRSASGIVIVTVFSAPFSCPHGTCVFCPGGPKWGTPQSYVPDGPSQRIARSLAYDPYRQTRRSLRKYSDRGHDTSKAETIIEGGTFIALPEGYRGPFVKAIYEGLNGSPAPSLEEAQRANESAPSRCVGLTIESKPDWCREKDIDLMLAYGVTRLEVGVQSMDDEVLRLSNRGHTVEDSVRAFQVARDAGLKVAAHMMPGLPGSDPDRDARGLRRLFDDQEFRPDMMKMYPTLVVEGTALAKMCEAGLYRPYDLGTVIELISEMKRHVPRWHRIMRVMREIPEGDISAGVSAGNLRELVLARVAEKGFSCGCIRCREVALGSPSDLEGDELRLTSEGYTASAGEEVFASYEYERAGKIAAFVRMRCPSPLAHRPEMRGACVVRELKVYGRVVTIGGRDEDAWQHRGLGTKLMSEAERVARERFGAKRMLVTAAVGTRNYYRRLGYERDGPYMAKRLGR